MRNFFKKHRIVSFVLGAALALATGASAAWIVFNYIGTDGTTSGGFATIQNQNTSALAFSNDGAAPATLSPSTTEVVPLLLTNKNPNAAESIQNLTRTFTSSPADCADHLTTSSYSANVLAPVPAGTAIHGTVSVDADSTLPLDCSAGSFTITFVGGSNP